MITLKDISEMHRKYLKDKHPTVPGIAIPTKRYSDKTANKLTDAIVDFMRYSGNYADRVNNMGVWRKQITIDRGHEVIVRPGGYIKSGTRKGIADIMGTKKGMMVAIEVKIGKDRQSKEQKAIEKEIIAAGGTYIIARTWQNFIEQWEQI